MTRDTKVVRLAVIPGDGIGPEVVAATVPALHAALEAEGHRLDVTSFDWGGERFLRQGAAMPADAADLVRKTDAGNATTADVASAVLHAMKSQGWNT
ncbi:isocitrate/isopropylmalate family dehydrogenase [Streptomyces sp. 2A115]|uniref:isocitrate/isopropylmalate family dehydrogenase n=1 Tax=Streptomyces sp. 2A115 TaxID=3457439 RepID=UPI003FD0A3BC